MIYCGEPQVGQLEREYVMRVLDSGRLSEGEWVRSFAVRLAGVIDRPVAPVASGTAALHVALLAVGVQPGDEVIVPATTYVATANAALLCGAKVRVCDVDEKTWTIDPLNLADLLTDKTAAVVPVHLYGVPADIEAIEDELELHYRRTGRRVAIVEDCAEALGAATKQGRVGSLGDAAAFSFYGSKTITTGGEGGAVAWADWRVGGRAEHVAHQSMTDIRYYHDCVGFNYRMTEMQAAVGVAQMTRLNEFLDKRRQVFDWYDQRLGEHFFRQALPDGFVHGYWAYAVKLPTWGSVVAEKMLAAGVETRPVFPPLWQFPHVGGGDFVVKSTADCIRERGLVLPTHCGLTEDDVDTVCKELIRAVESS
jgi:perosamine synthetase